MNETGVLEGEKISSGESFVLLVRVIDLTIFVFPLKLISVGIWL